jgi:hypothetical protein
MPENGHRVTDHWATRANVLVELDIAMTGHSPQSDQIALTPDIAQAHHPVDVQDHLRSDHAEREKRDEALAPGEDPCVGSEVAQKLNDLLSRLRG